MKRLMLVLLVMVMTIAWSVTAFADSPITYSANTLLTNDVTLTIEPATETQVYKVEVKWTIVNGHYTLRNGAVRWDEASANFIVDADSDVDTLSWPTVTIDFKNLSTHDIAYNIKVDLSPYDSNSQYIDTILGGMGVLPDSGMQFAPYVSDWNGINGIGKTLPANDKNNLGNPSSYYRTLPFTRTGIMDDRKLSQAIAAHYATSGTAFSDSSSYHDKYTLTITPVTSN